MDMTVSVNDSLENLVAKRRYVALDAMKFLCALMVLEVHFPTFLYPYVLYICRLAVPFFLLVTGFFLVGDDGVLHKQRIASTFRKLLNLFIVVTLISVAVKFLVGPSEFIANFSFWRDFKIWLLRGDLYNLCLWYVCSLLQCLAMMYVLVALGRQQWLWPLAVLGLLGGLLFGHYSFFFEDSFDLAINRNFLTISLPCLLAGIAVRRNMHRLPPMRKLLELAAITFLLLTVEAFTLDRISDGRSAGELYVFTLPLAVLIFAICLNIPNERVPMQLSNLGRRYSADIFFYQFPVFYLLTAIVAIPRFELIIVAVPLCIILLSHTIRIALPRLLQNCRADNK